MTSSPNRILILLGLMFFIIAVAPAAGQTTLHGRVHDASGTPLRNVSVSVPAHGLKTVSNERGEFALQVKSDIGPISLVFDYPDYYSQTASYQPADSSTEFDVTLTPRTVVKQEVTLVASRLDIPLAINPAASSVIDPEVVDAMPRGVGAEEALQGVPGIKIDNQANGERVHVSIRGQGILSEHGLRGIQVLLDGIPLNDPTGFAPDLFDIDWKRIEELQVVRGPVAVLYGGGSAGGIINIRTGEATNVTHGGFWSTGGSNGFYKTRADLTGIVSGMGYSLALSRTAGDGYRQHTAFFGDNFSSRFDFNPTSQLRLNAMFWGTGYFNQNAEGLNLTWLRENRQMANPDALTYNEYQKTVRYTGGLTGTWTTSDNQHFNFTFFARHTQYDEPVPSSIDHRAMKAPGGSFQYNLELGKGSVKNYFSAGSDLDAQFIGERKYPNLGGAVPGSDLVADQGISQKRAAAYAMDRLGLGKHWTVFLSGRWDRIGNQLTDHLKADGVDLSGDRTFTKGTGRVGVTWTPRKEIAIFTSWGQGFLPPATEELDSNPAHHGGFNMSLVPATSTGEEVGARGSLGQHLVYETTFFHLTTQHDFERYRMASRPLETFYGNAGETRRYGLETEAHWVTHRLTLAGAYTYSHFTYTSYHSLNYPGNLVGNFLPNSPAHQFFVDALLRLPYSMSLDVNAIAFSRAFIDPTNATFIGGYGLLNARVSKVFRRNRYSTTAFVSAKNLTAQDYIAFTEPDPDGNSYQPGAEREVFGGIELRF